MNAQQRAAARAAVEQRALVMREAMRAEEVARQAERKRAAHAAALEERTEAPSGESRCARTPCERRQPRPWPGACAVRPTQNPDGSSAHNWIEGTR
ncbi:hypothetical protein [Stigmatella erecta]|uniref:hypothetical protein n=1 Tax=Stigmatella erecta TaxID=83460 RepID=UPI000B8038E1|nr:hypothetical protein [Stigmatella erecta]